MYATGFFITGMMKRCWAAQMEVLSDINRICEKYHIQYFADSDVYEDFLEVYRWFVSEGFGELDESEDVISVVRSCDGYYGDPSDLAWYACDSGSPALLIDYDVHTDAQDE